MEVNAGFHLFIVLLLVTFCSFQKPRNYVITGINTAFYIHTSKYRFNNRLCFFSHQFPEMLTVQSAALLVPRHSLCIETSKYLSENEKNDSSSLSIFLGPSL